MKRITNLTNMMMMWAVALLLIVQVSSRHSIAQSNQTPGPESVRQMLATQPDYTAIRQFQMLEPRGGFGATSKVAKLGRRYREENDDTIFIHEPRKPTIRLFPKLKQYDEMDAAEKDFEFSPAELAKRNDIIIKFLDKEMHNQYKCIKIEVSYKDEKLKDLNVVFYVAPELKNLVVGQETTMGPVKLVTVLSNVEFNAKEEMFQIPIGYKRAAK